MKKKMQIVIDNYFKLECDVNTSIRNAYEKGFRTGVKKGIAVRPELEQSMWIPCSERLPEEDGQYLTTVKYKHVNDSYEDVYAEHGEWFDGKWDMFSFGHCGEVEDIIAWMPLPEPYKMDEVTK